MAINKVIYGDETLIDLTEDTVNSDVLAKGVTAHRRDGVVIEGELDLEGMIADEYDSTATYSVGDYVLYEGVLYQCITDISTPEAWNTEHWEAVTVTDELKEKADISEVEKKADAIVSSASGDIITIEDGADDLPVKSLEVSLLPVQNLNGQDAPYPPGGSANKFQTTATTKTENGVTWTVNSDGSVTVSGTASGYTSLAVGRAILDGMTGNVTVAYNTSEVTNISWANTDIRDADDNVLYTITSGGAGVAKYTVDLTSYPTAHTLNVTLKRNNNVATSGTIKVQVVSGSDALTWQPYSNLCPISGWTGVEVTRTGENLYGGQSLADSIVNAVNNQTNTYKGEDTNGRYVTFSAGSAINGKVFAQKFKPNTAYTAILKMTRLQSGHLNSNITVRYTDGTGSTIYIDSTSETGIYTVVFTTNSAKSVENFSLTWGGGRTYLYYDESGIFEGVLTADDFKPYNGNTYPISWQSSAGTVYGGSLDVTSGVLTVTHDYYRLLSTWGWNKSTSYSNAYYIGFSTAVNNVPLLSNILKTVTTASEYSANEWSVYHDLSINVHADSNYDTTAKFKQWLADNEVYIVRPLKTVVEYQLTPNQIATFLGNNSFWSNGNGQIDLEYRADTGLYIQMHTPDDVVTEEELTQAVNGLTEDINGVANKVGALTDLTTTDKSNVVAAINELDSDVNELQEGMETKAEIDGYYEDLTAGSAEQLISSVAISDNAPYNFRTSGGNVDIGDRETDKLIGGTVAWNQIARNSYAPSSRSGLTITKSDDSFIVEGTASALASATGWFDLETANVMPLENHVLLMDYQLISGTVSGGTVKFGAYYTKSADLINLGETKIKKVPTGLSTTTARSYWEASSGTVFTSAKMRVQVFDLTQMFGSTIADYLYALETANTGDGVAWFKKLFPKPYYAYNAGELMSVKTSAHQMTGFNQFDADTAEDCYMYAKNGTKAASVNPMRSVELIKVIPSTSYYLKSPRYENVWNVVFFDINKNGLNRAIQVPNNASGVLFTTPSDCYYVGLNMLTSDKGIINFNLHWDGERDGEYEAYKEHSYALDPDLELRGILKLDANDELYYDGDTYESDGTVTRKYGIVDLGTLTWVHTQANRSRTNGLKDVIKIPSDAQSLGNYVTEKGYNQVKAGSTLTTDNQYSVAQDGILIFYYDSTEPSGYFVYELATPTTEEADPYTNPQIVNDWGTEEYIDIRDVQIPVGHETLYQANLKAKLEMAPNSPSDGDGDYIVRQTNGENSYVKLVKELPVQPDDTVDYALKSNSESLSWQKYDEMIVGNAKQLISSVGVEDQVPYNFRTSGGSNDIGTLEEDTVVGGTLVWNQLVDPKTSASTVGGLTFTPNDGVWTVTGTPSQNVVFQPFVSAPTYIEGHKYYISGCPSGGANGTYSLRYNSNGFGENGNGLLCVAVPSSKSPNSNEIRVGSNFPCISVTSTVTISGSLVFKPVLYDLTQMLGSTIADYIYSLGSVNGIAKLKRWGFFQKDYYAYNAGGLMSVKTSAHQMTRFNQLDEDTAFGALSNISKVGDAWVGTVSAWINTSTGTGKAGWEGIRYFPYTSYCCSAQLSLNNGGSTSAKVKVYYTDGTATDGNAIAAGSSGISKIVSNPAKTVRYFGITYGSGTGGTISIYWMNINLHWDGERDGEYEPYKLESYPLDSDLELRGIPKLDASNNLYYDGDIYEPDGTVTRKYGIVDLGTLTWMKTGGNYFYTVKADAKLTYAGSVGNIACSKYVAATSNQISGKTVDKSIAMPNESPTYYMRVYDSAYESLTVDQFKTEMNGVYCVYELATPTTEEADPYTTPQIVDDWGTEEYVDTRDVPIPVGHKTFYQANLKAKLEMAPDSPGDGDGLYAVRQTDGENSYEKIIFPTELPAAPTTDGSYRLKVTVTNGTPVLSWESVS